MAFNRVVNLLPFYFSFMMTLTGPQNQADTKSSLIEKLRTKYNVPIRLFHARKPYGFVSFRSIWINIILLKSKKPLLFAFYHEYYHLQHNHKRWSLFTRLIVGLTPLTKYFVNWGIVIAIILITAYLGERLRGLFEKNANKYAEEKVSEWTE